MGHADRADMRARKGVFERDFRSEFGRSHAWKTSHCNHACYAPDRVKTENWSLWAVGKSDTGRVASRKIRSQDGKSLMTTTPLFPIR